MCAPIDGWFFICEYSSSVNLAGFNKILSGIPILPISWNNPPILSVFICSAGKPNFSPINTEYSDTLSECPRVYESLASTVYLSVCTISKYACSNCSFESSNFSFILLISSICFTDFIADSINNNSWSNLSLFSQYPCISNFFIVSNGGAKSLWPVSNNMYNSLLNFLISSTTSSPCNGVIIKSSNIKSKCSCLTRSIASTGFVIPTNS